MGGYHTYRILALIVTPRTIVDQREEATRRRVAQKHGILSGRARERRI